MRRFFVLLGLLAATVAVTAAAVHGDTVVAPGGGTPGTSKHFKLVGHDPLFARGMNAAPALYDDGDRTFVYVGNRTDGSETCGAGDPRQGSGPCVHPHPGILIIDTTNPARPRFVGEIGPPHAAQRGITTRELRVWPEKKLLMVMTFRCSSTIHACPTGNDQTFPFDIKFFDLRDPVHPRFIRNHVTRSSAGLAIKPHELFLWIDPEDEDRALLWESTPTTSANPNRPNLLIEDISDVPSGGPVRLVAEGNWNQFYPGSAVPSNYDNDLALHSMAPNFDGTTTQLAYLRGHHLVLDTSKVAENRVPPGTVESLNDDLLTPVENRARWGTADRGCTSECAESHSAVPVPGRALELNTDEVYGRFALPQSFGCPWGWMRLIDVSDPAHPRIVGEYKIRENTREFCLSGNDPATENFTSFASHNPTVLPRLALLTWHSGGLQAVDIGKASRPRQAGWFSPDPLPSVATEDPALSNGPNKVVMWSYPIIHQGLIYVVDIRNGLYILDYRGAHRGDVKKIDFYEGNSNLGDSEELADE